MLIKIFKEKTAISNLQICEDFHISVSKTFQIKLKTFTNLTQSLDKQIESIQK